MFTGITTDVLVTMSSLAVVVTGFVALFAMCRPFNIFKSVMYVVCLGLCIAAVIVLYDLFKYVPLGYTDKMFLIIVCFASYMLYQILTRFFNMLSKSAEDAEEAST